MQESLKRFKKKNRELKTKNKSIETISQNYLKYSGIIIFIILFLVLYFRKSILGTILNSQTKVQSSSSFFISSAHAQENQEQKKKS
jgi:hypothetical protein